MKLFAVRVTLISKLKNKMSSHTQEKFLEAAQNNDLKLISNYLDNNLVDVNCQDSNVSYFFTWVDVTHFCLGMGTFFFKFFL